MKILFVTDAWVPQTNGVVTTLCNLITELKTLGHETAVFSSQDCTRTLTIPTYKEIQIGFPKECELEPFFNWADHIHIVTLESPLGAFAAKYCKERNKTYTASYHTNFSQYVKKMFSIPEKITNFFIRRLYRDATVVMAPSHSTTVRLRSEGYGNVVPWTRGVDRNIFNPGNGEDNRPKDRYRIICVSRISKEKNLEDFFEIARTETAHDSKPIEYIMVGDGPLLNRYRKQYPYVRFVGKKTGNELAKIYRSAHLFVFPSRSDTFGIVNIESMACGTPVVSYDVEGPIDIVKNKVNGYIEDYRLKFSMRLALMYFEENAKRKRVSESVKDYTWENCATQFLEYITAEV